MVDCPAIDIYSVVLKGSSDTSEKTFTLTLPYITVHPSPLADPLPNPPTPPTLTHFELSGDLETTLQNLPCPISKKKKEQLFLSELN